MFFISKITKLAPLFFLALVSFLMTPSGKALAGGLTVGEAKNDGVVELIVEGLNRKITVNVPNGTPAEAKAALIANGIKLASRDVIEPRLGNVNQVVVDNRRIRVTRDTTGQEYSYQDNVNFKDLPLAQNIGKIKFDADLDILAGLDDELVNSFFKVFISFDTIDESIYVSHSLLSNELSNKTIDNLLHEMESSLSIAFGDKYINKLSVDFERNELRFLFPENAINVSFGVQSTDTNVATGLELETRPIPEPTATLGVLITFGGLLLKSKTRRYSSGQL